jgi:UDP-N-acetylmuramoylalanine--D-glutamate ligase
MWDKMKVPAFEYDDLGDAVLEAMDMSDKGDVILLSPAFASFGMFKNEYDRGEKFNKIVNKI